MCHHLCNITTPEMGCGWDRMKLSLPYRCSWTHRAFWVPMGAHPSCQRGQTWEASILCQVCPFRTKIEAKTVCGLRSCCHIQMILTSLEYGITAGGSHKSPLTVTRTRMTTVDVMVMMIMCLCPQEVLNFLYFISS